MTLLRQGVLIYNIKSLIPLKQRINWTSSSKDLLLFRRHQENEKAGYRLGKVFAKHIFPKIVYGIYDALSKLNKEKTKNTTLHTNKMGSKFEGTSPKIYK